MGRGVGVRGVAAAVVVAGALALPATASAGVPKGDYGCYGEAGTYISTLKIKSSSKYSYLGKGGKYEFKSGPKVLKFTSGALKPWVGKLLKTSDGPEIKLTTDQAGGQTVNCLQS